MTCEISTRTFKSRFLVAGLGLHAEESSHLMKENVPLNSPRSRARSPRRRSKSPRRCSKSQRRSSKSPRRTSKSTRTISKSPRRRSGSPQASDRIQGRVDQELQGISKQNNHLFTDSPDKRRQQLITRRKDSFKERESEEHQTTSHLSDTRRHTRNQKQRGHPAVTARNSKNMKILHTSKRKRINREDEESLSTEARISQLIYEINHIRPAGDK